MNQARTPAKPRRDLPGPPLPGSVAAAVRLMYAGAALSLISLVVSLLTATGLSAVVRQKHPGYTPQQVHAAVTGDVISGVVIQLVAIGLWVMMARVNGAGRGWGRVVASVLFGLSTVNLLIFIARPHKAVVLALVVLVWLAGLGAIVALWRRESASHFSGQGPG